VDSPAIQITPIAGSVCAPRGFQAAGVSAGIKPSGNPDVALVVSDAPAQAAGVFTTNVFRSAPVIVSGEHLRRAGTARAVAANSGCSNACTGEQGLANARRMAEVTAGLIGCEPWEVQVASTGVIGRQLPMERVVAGLELAAAVLAPTGGPTAARAIMTTDTRPKETAVEVACGEVRFRLGGIAKGSGMIAPNMATMLAYVTTDAAVPAALLDSLLREAADRTFNCLTIDGDTSTSDTLLVLANGLSGVEVTEDSGLIPAFRAGLLAVCETLAKELARDGEGATKLVEVRVTGLATAADARRVGLAIGNSPLVKTALFGNDPNWGRIVCAAGYSGVRFDPARVDLTLAGIPLVRGGEPAPFDEPATRAAMQVPEVAVEIAFGEGDAAATIWTCDMSYDYVRINAEYTT
jgi:glutamate N-acetyltransferase/amino-acid N-acetyltransferase